MTTTHDDGRQGRPFDHLLDGEPDLETVAASGPEMLGAALDYASRGWRLIPLHVPTRFGPQGAAVDRAGCSCYGLRTPFRSELCVRQAKHGIAWFHRKYPHAEGTAMLTGGITAATTDLATIERWWTLLPGAGIGVDCRRSGLVVLDVDDDRARGVLRSLVAEHGPLDAWVALTGRGSHHWLTVPEGMRTIAGGALSPLEIKTTQVTAPPSWHATGARYSWVIREGEHPPLAPSWLLRPHEADRGTRVSQSASGTPRSRYAGIGHGTRPALKRFHRFLAAVEDADDGRHDLLVRAWFAAGSFVANGWLDPEWVQEVLGRLTGQCGAKHLANLEGFHTAMRSGLDDPQWARG